ncbi:MAG: hypothetical protein AAB532_03760 [Patescibacteria group bacterium]
MNLFKKLSLLFIASFLILFSNVFPIKSANAASFDVKLSVANDSNENKDWNNSSIDKCYVGDVEVQVRDANSTRTVKYTSGPNSCSHAIKVYNSPEAGEPTVYTVKLIKPSKTLNYIDVFNPATNQHATSKGSAISTSAISPSYKNSTVTFGLPSVYKLNVAYVLKDKNNNFSIDANENCYTGKLDLLVNGKERTWSRTGGCTPRFSINHDGTSKIKIVLPDNSDFIYAGYKKSDDKSNHVVKLVTDSPRNIASINGDGTVYFFIKEKTNGGGGGNACSDPKITLDGKNGNTFNLSLKNPCKTEHNYQLKANAPGGSDSNWKAKINGSKVNANDVITVKAGKTGKFNVVVTPPNNPSAGTHTTVVSATQKDGNSRNKDTIKLKTEIGQKQACSFKNPKLISTDNDKNGQKGDTITYNVELKNNNSSCKDPADFNITVEKPNEWNVNVLNGQEETIKGEVKNLKSEQTKLLKVKVTSPTSAKKGETYEIKIKAVQKGHTNLKDTVILKYTVGRQNDNTCTGSEVNPYFTCQSNACVVVNACGTNTGGCTQAGQACGDGGKKITKLSFVIGLNTIGTTGTNTVALFANSNKDPKHPKRTLNVEVFNNLNEKVEEVAAEINYVASQSAQNYGKFIGTATLAEDFVTGAYTVKVKADGRLKKQIPGIQNLTAGKTHAMSPVNLIAGDVDNDNKLGLIDYGILISCSIFAKTEKAKALCNQDESYRLLSDLNDDGKSEDIQNIDQLDYGYFIQEYSVQAGD